MKKVVVGVSLLFLSSLAFAQGNPNPISGPADSTDQGLDAELVKKAAPRFYGVGFDFSLYEGTGLNALNYSNAMTMYFEPSWAIGKQFARGTRLRSLNLGVRFVLTAPVVPGTDEGNYRSDSDLGPAVPCSDLKPGPNGTIDPSLVARCPVAGGRGRSTIPGDTWVTLANPKLFVIPKLLIAINPSVRAILPTSIESQYQTLYLSLTGQLGVSRSFFKDKLTLGYTFGATKFFHRYRTPVFTTKPPTTDLPLAHNLSIREHDISGNFITTPAGSTNPDFGFRHIFAVDVSPTDKLSISLLYILLDTFRYPQSNDTVAVGPDGQPFNVQAACQTVSGGNCGRAHSDSQVFWFTVGYQFLDWLNVSVAWITYAPLRMPDNSYRQGVVSVDYNAFTQLSLGASISIDKLAAKLF